MEKDQVFKYCCKLCSKRFPCGRSLGGHMKSHLIIKSRGEAALLESGSSEAAGGYGLRENPRKSWRTMEACRECGKGFQSWKGLVAHVKCCHSNLSTNSFENDAKDCWTSAKVVESQSENETSNDATRIRRATRRRARYMSTSTTTTTTSSNPCVVNNDKASSSVTEIEQEQQEEVAWCLMMLSRDVGHWDGIDFVVDNDRSTTSDDNSGFSDAPSALKMNQVCEIKDVTRPRTLEVKKVKNFSEIGKAKKSLILKETELAGAQLVSSKKFNSSKRKLQLSVYDDKSAKRSKYECGTCSKVFRSYQALGGHRASHKKNKGCFISKTESSENSAEFDTDRPVASDHSKLSNLNIHDQDIVPKAESISSSTTSKGHSCPICLKVFSTGQALGGHKRSHMIDGTNVSNNNNQSTPEVRDLLDLNLPAPVEEESTTNHAAASSSVQLPLKPWWAGSNHKPYEAVVS